MGLVQIIAVQWTRSARPLLVIAALPAQLLSCAPRHRRRQARNGQKGIGAILNPLVPAIVHIFRGWSQELNRIGATGVMVIRLKVVSNGDAGTCRLLLRGPGSRVPSPIRCHHLTTARLRRPVLII